MPVEPAGEVGHEHYPYVTRSLLRLYGAGVLTNVTDVVIEPEYGYAAQITYADGSRRITYGNDLGLNAGAACDLAKDKGFAKFMLRTIDINCPEGEEFVMPWWEEAIRPSLERRGHSGNIKTAGMIESYIEENMGYPAYLKPVAGSKGSGIFKVYQPQELRDILGIYNEARVRVAMVEEPIDMPDYRVVLLDGELISAYRRVPLAVTGDGSSTIRELILSLQGKYEAEGRDTRLNPDDPRISQYIGQQGLTVEDRLEENQGLVLVAISNLSAGGTSEDVTELINPAWVDLASFVAKNFNLRLCGVDLACEAITQPDANYSILEVNAAPGLDHYASSGEAQSQIVDALYAKVFNSAANS